MTFHDPSIRRTGRRLRAPRPTTTNAPVGPPICVDDPPSNEIRNQRAGTHAIVVTAIQEMKNEVRVKDEE